MKTWNEIEQRLKAETREEIPPGLHHQILRAVRDDRAATSQAGHPRHFASYWLMAGTLATAVVAMASILFLPPFGSQQVAETPTTPAFSLASLETFATAPMQTEVEALRTDLTTAARYLADFLPGTASGS